jgi:hypothetical protein
MLSFEKLEGSIKIGDECLTFNDEKLQFTLHDFWKWSFSNILSNTIRGVLAEFIVATATDIDIKNVREEWKPYDLETPNGIKLEIKSAAYLQTWSQKKPSNISFSTKPTFFWDSSKNEYEKEKKRHADIYVFCLLHHTDKTTVDPLNLNQWKFYVVATGKINEYSPNQNSISLKELEKLTKPISYIELNSTIKSVIKHDNQDSQ